MNPTLTVWEPNCFALHIGKANMYTPYALDHDLIALGWLQLAKYVEVAA